MELHECVNFLLTKAQQSVFQYFKAMLSEYDVTPVQYGILKCLWNENAQTPRQIAASLCLDSSTITGILDRMENKGLVRRTPDPDDRRALRVVLTDLGSQLRQPVEETIQKANEHILGSFSGQEREQVLNFLERFSAFYNND